MDSNTKPLGWHAAPPSEALAYFDSSPQGLAEAEVSTRLEQYGPNRLPEPPKKSAWVRFFRHFHNILIYVLVGSAAITAALGHFVDMSVILAVVLANAVIGFVQEGKAEKALQAIRGMLAPQASVIRDGERRSIEAERLVPGDLVLLEAGDKVPADLRLIEARGLQVQESILTGESVPVEKGTEPVFTDAPLGERSSLAYSGTLITGGFGKGVVVAIGAKTEIGRISGMLGSVATLSTPLIEQMDRFGKWLAALILLVAALLLVFGYFVGDVPFSEMFMAVVGLSVAAIPEGLPAVLTITLAVGVQAMARRNAIIRRLPAIETLGAVSVICTDKTGTLTRNEMMVTSVATVNCDFAVEGTGYDPAGAVTLDSGPVDPRAHPALEEIARVAALCNDAVLWRREGDWTIEGDPMEGALLALAGKLGLGPREARENWTRTDSIPFDADRRFMATLDHDHAHHAVISVKGAPEQVLDLCGDQRGVDGVGEPLDGARWLEAAERIAARGQRVLALALKPVDPEHTILEFADIEGKLTMLGLVGLIDPPRPEAIDAVADCRRAGIRVKMITGDHRGTAAAIGRQIALENSDAVLTGSDLDAMDDTMLSRAVLETDIFARTSPEVKLRLVMALQSQGLTVAMTGDGVNDAPALKRADAGIAMGIKGSAAAKEAAEFVLADDNFASIAAAVREGRTVFDNIKKVISWTLPTNAGEAMTIIVALLLGMTLPITPIQILWVNLITATTLGIALAFEPTEGNTMRRPPRLRDAPLLSSDLVWHILLVSALFICGMFGMFAYGMGQGYPLDLVRTLALNTLVVMEIFYLFFIRNIYGTSLTWRAVRGTRAVWISIGVVTAGQFAITYVPFLQRVFDTESVPFTDGLLVVGVGVALFAIIETEKQVRLHLRQLRVG